MKLDQNHNKTKTGNCCMKPIILFELSTVSQTFWRSVKSLTIQHNVISKSRLN